jgi:hypothetical protein
MIVTPAPLLAKIPFVLAAAFDAAKCPAVWSAIKGGLVHGLVTHTSLARGLLALANGGDGTPQFAGSNHGAGANHGAGSARGSA